MPTPTPHNSNRERVVQLLTASAFLIFFQTYLFAPLIPSLAREFTTSEATIGWLIPAFMIPYGCCALIYGPLGDRWGRKRIVITLLGLTVLSTLFTASSRTIGELMVWRVLGGIVTGGIIPISIALTGDLFPYKERGRPLGWIYSGMAGGAAFGSSLGAYLNPIIGWRVEMFVLGLMCAVIFFAILRFNHAFAAHKLSAERLAKTVFTYFQLLKTDRGSRAYILIFFNSAFHSGVFSWLGAYFATRYGLGDRGVGLALLGYGIPGMMFGPIIGKWADRTGRNRLIPLGLAIGAFSAICFAFQIPLWWSATLAAILSLGYDLTQPLLGGLISSLDADKRGQSMSLSAFFLFVGFGIGPIAFQNLAHGDLKVGLLIFGFGEIALFVFGAFALKNESALKTAHLV